MRRVWRAACALRFEFQAVLAHLDNLACFEFLIKRVGLFLYSAFAFEGVKKKVQPVKAALAMAKRLERCCCASPFCLWDSAF